MTRDHGYIRTVLHTIREVKGPPHVELHALHWSPDNPATRDVIATGSPVAPEPESDAPAENGEQSHRKNIDGVLEVDEIIEFIGKSPCNGYIHLFNLGTSGTCLKLAPSREHPDNYIAAETKFRLPSEKHLSRNALPGGAFRVTGPTTRQGGEPERLLAIITAEDIVLQIEDLHPKLEGRDLLTRCAGRGASFGGEPKKDRPELFCIPPEKWEYGLLQMRVEA